ncbi:macro domain-containing protein [Aurantimonas coralicida]|uniref:macro domain-containing protein n=1 Tax=Aurantimonas coralicida TaxID=182270 RepID=UPI001D182957|nr:macro domain-containing protein [Aurantimonas coralicida]MCC4299582.1 macro domain-containing protein [Aurantimonas coralicida]
MLIYKRTSILEASSQTVVNTVNCVGVMGKGLAHEFRKLEPEMFLAYKDVCEQKLLEPGKLWLWRGAERWVLNFPTKKHWRNPSKIEWIEMGLQKFVASYESRGIREIAFPRLGCGNGNLDWSDVRPLMEHYLSDLEIPTFIHDHTVDIGMPEHLECVIQQLRAEDVAGSTFEDFLANVHRLISLAGSDLVDLETRQPLRAHLLADENITIESEDASWIFEEEDLRGVWVGLQTGLVTENEAGWSVRGGGRPLISVLSVLPELRPIEIQRGGSSTPELAIELKTGAHLTTVGSYKAVSRALPQ